MKRNKILALVTAGMLVLGSCVPSVTAYATEGTEEALVVTESTAEFEDGQQAEEAQETEKTEETKEESQEEKQETTSKTESAISEDAISVDDFASLDEVAEEVLLSENADVLTDDAGSDKVLEGESSEEKTYNNGQLIAVQDLQWDRAGYISFTMPQAGVYYTIIMKRPDANPSVYSGLSCQADNTPYTFNFCNNFFGAGTYSVRVKTTTNPTDMSFGGDAVTNWIDYEYVRPANVFAAPTDLYWGDNGTAYWNAVDQEACYYVSFYKDGERQFATSTSSTSYTVDTSMHDLTSGSWTFTVIAYGYEPGDIASSPESQMSSSYKDGGTSSLPRVTDAKWVRAGRLSFKCPKADAYYTLFIKKPDGSIFRHSGLTVTSDGGAINYSGPEHFIASGEYSFAVKTTDRSNDYDNTSGTVTNWITLNYVRPNNVFSTPTNPRWLDDGTAAWDAVSGNPNYYVYFYKNGQLYHAMPNRTNTSVKNQYIDLSEGTWTFKVIAYSSNPEETAASEYSVLSAAYGAAAPTKNGLVDAGDGNWYLYDNGVVQTSYNGLYNDATHGWWLVLGGKVAFDYNDLYCDANCGWWKISGGAVDFGYSELYNSPSCGWWKINGGTVDFGYSELYNSPSCGWWKINGGAVDFGYNDLYNSPSCGWWKINGGAVDFGYSELYNSPSCGWWKVEGGYVDFGYTDLYYSPSCGWWKINGGAVDFGYTDVFKSPSVGNWKVNGGAVDFGYTGYYNSPKYGRCYVNGGMATF